jgi:thiamine pyrophosphokinase
VEIYNVTDALHLYGRAGSVCSLLTFSDSCAIDEMRGFQYLLSQEMLFPSSRGLSNRIVDEHACIKKRSGTLVVVVNRI